MQKFNVFTIILLSSFLISLTSCEAIGDIFKAGVWTGLFLVAIVIVIIIWLISRFRK